MEASTTQTVSVKFKWWVYEGSVFGDFWSYYEEMKDA